MYRAMVGLFILTVLAASCGQPADQQEASSSQASPELTLPPPTIAPPGATRGEPTQDCVEGWQTPEEGSARWERPLRVIGRTLGVAPRFQVVEIRYFQGPESPPSVKNYLEVVQRWYVKAFHEDDDSIRGRFLVESRRFGAGVSAVAPYDTEGFESPDWVAFKYDRYAEPMEQDGLPGAWMGEPYDFVLGDPLDEELPGDVLTIPGVPEEVEGCLVGT